MAASCTEGVRKKAKYLQDDDLEVASPASGVTSSGVEAARQESVLESQDNSSAPLDSSYSDPLLGFPLANNYNFGSETVNLEYSILSNMLASDLEPTVPQSLQQPAILQTPPEQPKTTFTGGDAIATMNSPGNPPAGNQPPPSGGTSDVYASVTRPYDYREGFHYLVKYVKERMEKDDIMRICRALAQFRPSFMAQIMNLSAEDLLFMEKCFQRTLMEFDKLIGFSGTPTVLWRRTGEIALVGKEFSILTQWSRDDLLGKKTYIYELMDNQSAVDYWEKFSLIAFDNSQQSVMTTCTLLSPRGRPVPCAFCFTIKRDIFDVPLAVVGNFLPLFRAL
ncbi:Transcriptional regulator of nonfermentable carbon utilization [Rhizophlyctis rosea]|uniref:Transcriptional regulator of nonfermentable carbon utilization n=1 Tax=Rhizophlyctis rosea TaxID=64517 RepID=A0AAD5SL98_9FUNG|nr:Transcriptional regulator of nonfermentable carbon utilization [Rhizophlyctis rosea]